MALRVPKNSLDLECTHQEMLVLAAAKISLTREFTCFSQLDTRQFACKFQVDTFFSPVILNLTRVCAVFMNLSNGLFFLT